MTEDKGGELALSGDIIRMRHIATRASNRRKIVVLVVGDVEFDGYAIGLDGHTLQMLELPSGEVSSVALEYIVSISDGMLFKDLEPDEKAIVDRRTASFRKTCGAWLEKNWPDVYDRRLAGVDNRDRARVDVQPARVNSRMATADYRARREFEDREKRLNGDGDSEVRERTSEDRDQA